MTDHDDARALVPVTPDAGVEPASPVLRPALALADLIASKSQVDEVIRAALKDGRDYGLIPGTNKPTLLKPGAEQLAMYYGLRTSYEIVEREAHHDRPILYQKRTKLWNNAFRGDRSFTWQVEEANSLGLYRYVVRCRLTRRTTEEVFGEGLGSCSTMESKYVDRPRDVENTVLKMAQKRALIAAVLNALALSDRFTQDMEDVVDNARAAGDEVHAEPAEPPVATTYEEACAVSYPGTEKDWKGLGGTPLRRVSLPVIRQSLAWLDNPKQAKIAAKYAPFIAALRLVAANDDHIPEE